jgi:hypothetical protein
MRTFILTLLIEFAYIPVYVFISELLILANSDRERSIYFLLFLCTLLLQYISFIDLTEDEE